MISYGNQHSPGSLYSSCSDVFLHTRRAFWIRSSFGPFVIRTIDYLDSFMERLALYKQRSSWHFYHSKLRVSSTLGIIFVFSKLKVDTKAQHFCIGNKLILLIEVISSLARYSSWRLILQALALVLLSLLYRISPSASLARISSEYINSVGQACRAQFLTATVWAKLVEPKS